MTIALVVSGIFVVLLFGFIILFKRHSDVLKGIKFTNEYRGKFIQLSNNYKSLKFDGELYSWLTMNVNRIQNELGVLGIMDYTAPYQRYRVPNYQLVINTIPKFRNGSIHNFEVSSVDDCLLRQLGILEEKVKVTTGDLKNPVIWFREGIKEIVNIPLVILSWFGIISQRTISSMMDSAIYKLFTGLIALITLVSGIVTIVVGYDSTIQIIKGLLTRQ